jgi:hypothetical protein
MASVRAPLGFVFQGFSGDGFPPAIKARRAETRQQLGSRERGQLYSLRPPLPFLDMPFVT